MQRAWVCAVALLFVVACGDDDGGTPKLDAGPDSSHSGTGGTGGDGGVGGVGGTSGTGGTGGNIDDAGALDAALDSSSMCDCPSPQTCDGDAGACECPVGYVDDLTAVCADIDECMVANDCDPDATCTNDPGSYRCACNLGFVGDGKTCEDDCVVALATLCDENAVCTKPNGSAECRCAAGYIDSDPSIPGTLCDPDPVCMLLACDPLAACDSTDANPACECPSGYADENGNGTVCTDINECLTSNGGCDSNAVCMNTAGGSTCMCSSGYSGDGIVCTDINECTDGTNTCSTNAACVNAQGTFSCACNLGHFGNGMSCAACTAITGCVSGLSCTTNADQTCGTCAAGYTGDGTGACTTCAMGTYENNNACVDCGTIANCNAVEICDVTNGSNPICPLCAPGFRGNGTNTCTACTAITNCASGLSCTTNADQTCGTCAAGTVGDGTGACTACGAGTYDNNNVCTDCGTISNCSATETCNVSTGAGVVCSTCALGYVGDGTGTCTACGTGTYDNNNVCTTCPQITNCNAVETCNVTNGNNSICPTCAPGFRGNGTGACAACTAIANCASGLTCTTNGNQTCGTCAPGYVGDGTGTCTACGTGTYDNNNVCTSCAQITNCNAVETCNVTNGNNSICPTCAAGFRGNGTGACAACTAIANCASGLTCTTNGNQTCGTCAPGYVGDGTGTCTACGTGTYDNNNVCTSCAQITNCGAVETCNVTNGNNSICPTCAPGFRGNGTGACAACTAIANCASGLTCTTNGNQTCGTCAPGYVGDGTGTCTACGTGTYDNNNVCTSCAQITNCNAVETCNVTNGNNSICPTCAAGFSGNGTGACTDINECNLNTDGCDSDPNACVNSPGGYSCECPPNYNDANPGMPGTVCEERCTNCDGNADCTEVTTNNFQCVCDAVDGFTGDGESCYCDLTGTWAVRVTIDIDWPAVAFYLKAGTATLYSYELRTFSYDGTTLNMTSAPCGGNDADLCGTGFWNNRAFGQTIPNNVWQSFAANPPQASMTLANAIPGTAFDTTDAAVFLGMRFNTGVNTLTYWPSSGAVTPNIIFDDPVVAPNPPSGDDGIGAESNTKTGNTTQCGGGYSYSPWPNVNNNLAREVTAFRSGSRSISRFAGDVISCDEIGGDLLGPDRNPGNTIDVPRVDARIAGCTVTPSSGSARPCTAAEITALNDQSKSQRVLGAQFSMVRVANGTLCPGVRSTTFPTY